MKFEVSENQQLKIEKWRRGHKKHCIQAWTFSYTSGIGESLVVRCSCGKELDVTEYEHW